MDGVGGLDAERLVWAIADADGEVGRRMSVVVRMRQ